MSILLEDNLPVVKYEGLNTNKAAVLGSTLAVTGAATFTAAPVFTSGIPSGAINGSATAIATQNGTPTIAQLLGGYINHASTTGAGTLTVPTGSLISAGITGVAVGTRFQCWYYNSGSQTVTITGDTGSTVTGGTAAVTTGKSNLITFVNTAANTWLVFPSTLF
jgi:hypothetical protein